MVRSAPVATTRRALARFVLAAALALAVAPNQARGADRFVSLLGDDAANDCLASTSPCRTISHVVTQSASSDVIKAAGGLYAEPLGIDASITLTLSGSWAPDFGSRDDSARSTILYGVQVLAGLGEVIDVTLDGVTVTRSVGVQAAAWDDGALDLTLANCAVKHNRSGSVSAVALQTSTVDLAISDSLISRNRKRAGPFYEIGGVVLDAYDTSSPTATITGSVIERSRPGYAPGIFAFGGSFGASTSSLDVSVTDTLLFRNGGGGLFAVDATNVSLTNVRIINNRGTGLSHSFGAMSVSNSVIAENRGFGGGVSSGGADATLDVVNSTIRRNRSICDFDSCSGGLGVDNGGTVDLVNTIIWDNTAIRGGGDDVAIVGSSASADHCDLGDVSGSLTDLGGNISSDPLFASATDAHLSAGSPAIDAGTCSGAPATDFEGDARPTGSGCDIGADEFVP